MKKYIFLFFSIIASGLFCSCSDTLDLQNDGRIDMSAVFADRYKTMGYLNSCYSYCPHPYTDRSSLCDDAENVGDNISGSKFSAWYNGSINASSFAGYDIDGCPWFGIGNSWTYFYEGIRKCNVFLANIWGAQIEATSEEKAGWAAQAHTLRALYYLQLIKRYGSVPLYDKPIGTNHDFSKDTKAKFSAVVKFILADCDSAIVAPASQNGFPWEIYNNQNGIMSRAIPYAIKSEAVTYAASPYWADGTYSWADATKANAEALYQCLTHDYSLYNITPDPTIAQNAYAIYFITNFGNDYLRTQDKETIYQGGMRMSGWYYNGLPTNPSMSSAGTCPSQELVDSYEMANGQPAITGYSDAAHLHPIINDASGYDPANPYAGRDPRFYASIYYNGAMKSLAQPGNASYNQDPQSTLNQLQVDKLADGSYTMVTLGGDPYVYLASLTKGLNGPTNTTLTFEYKSPTGISSPQIFFGPAIAENRSVHPANIPAASEWTPYTIDLSSAVTQFGFGNAGDFLRFDLGGTANVTIQIRNLQLNTKSTPSTVATYVGAAEGILQTDQKHTRTGYYLRKYNNYQSGLSNEADGAVRLFRLAEIYMNFAESAYESTGDPYTKISLGSGYTMSAWDAVNAIRARAGMPNLPTGLGKTAFETRYRNERRIEFAFEEHRYFDVRRWNILDQTDRFVTGMQITKNGSNYTYTRFKFNDRSSSVSKWLLYPINQDEVDKMIGFTGVNWQNPGW